jgi:hypothetical protein
MIYVILRRLIAQPRYHNPPKPFGIRAIALLPHGFGRQSKKTHPLASKVMRSFTPPGLQARNEEMFLAGAASPYDENKKA